jgi:hypothetical protein
MREEKLVKEMGVLIWQRSQMTQGDADDLAWDLLTLIKQERNISA